MLHCDDDCQTLAKALVSFHKKVVQKEKVLTKLDEDDLGDLAEDSDEEEDEDDDGTAGETDGMEGEEGDGDDEDDPLQRTTRFTSSRDDRITPLIEDIDVVSTRCCHRLV